MTGAGDGWIDWRTKGFWWPGPAVPFGEFVAAGHNLFGGAFTWPVLVARQEALERNVAALAGFCARHGLLFAPHAKTTMAPRLWAAQLAAGAWGMTAATPNQVLVLRNHGVPRVLLANEVLDPTVLRWIAAEVDRGFEVFVQVDSLAGVSALAGVPGERPVPVLAEVGYPGGRTGCRSVADVVEVARAVVASPRLALAGVAAYEGGLPDVAAARSFLAGVRASAGALAADGLLPASVLVAAGGSAYFDVVAATLGGAWLPGHDVRVVLRSGAYISHDHGYYQERTPFQRPAGEREPGLVPALELWAQVLSVPEPGLAIVGMGKRDAPFDEGLPVPLRLRRDGAVDEAVGLTVSRLNDHHAYLAAGEGSRLAAGDLVCFGISHPCTAFDKWRVIPVVDGDSTVTGLLETFF
jgi:D-serine deaminase-like pyridoxal phosphate-dependent protein